MALSRTTPGGVAYEEMAGSPTFTAANDKLGARQKWKIAWDSVDALTAECFPENQRIGDTFHFVEKLKFPGKPWLQAENLSIVPFGGKDAVPVWDGASGRNTFPTGGAVATITYGPQGGEEENDEDGDADEGVIASRSLTIGAEFMELPARLMTWTPPGKIPGGVDDIGIQDEDMRVGKIIPTVEHSLTIHRLAEVPFNAIADTVGKVNSVANLFGAAIGTLLFLGGSARRDKTVQGDTMWEIEYRWSQKIIKDDALVAAGEVGTWNHFYLPAEGTWGFVQTASTGGEPIYPSTDFAVLFFPDVA